MAVAHGAWRNAYEPLNHASRLMPISYFLMVITK